MDGRRTCTCMQAIEQRHPETSTGEDCTLLRSKRKLRRMKKQLHVREVILLANNGRRGLFGVVDSMSPVGRSRRQIPPREGLYLSASTRNLSVINKTIRAMVRHSVRLCNCASSKSANLARGRVLDHCQSNLSRDLRADCDSENCLSLGLCFRGAPGLCKYRHD